MGLSGAGVDAIGGPSLQSGLPETLRNEFEKKLGRHGFQAIKWLVKEFRLNVGYETLDEEAYIRFWLDRYYDRLRDTRQIQLPQDQPQWPTADEPVQAATREEVFQARRWSLEDVEGCISKLFEVKRLLCPHAPVLVPLASLQHYESGWDPASGVLKRASSSTKHWQAALNQHRQVGKDARLVVQPAEKRAASAPRRATPKVAQAKVKPTEVKDRLFPAASSVGQHLSDEHMVSRLIDLAIEFDGDPVLAASREGKQLLACGAAPQPRRRFAGYVEGRSDFEALQLLLFWQEFEDKPTFGLLMEPSNAAFLVKDRIQGTAFADNVLGVFFTRFKYECLDVSVVYRFWLSMPKAVRSANHVRGFPERRAFELLRRGLQEREEKRRIALIDGLPIPPMSAVAAAAAAASSHKRQAWQPNGKAPPRRSAILDKDAAQARDARVARAQVLPKEPKRPDLHELASHKRPMGALAYLRALIRQFPGDNTLVNMVRQCMDGGWSTRRGGPGLDKFELYNFVNDRGVHSRMSTLKKSVVHDELYEKPKDPTQLHLNPKDPYDLKKQKPFQLVTEAHANLNLGSLDELRSNNWINAVREKDERNIADIIDKLEKVQKDTAHITVFLRREAKQFPKGVRRVHHLEYVFAKLCQRFGSWEVLERFGTHYLPSQRGCVTGGFFSPGFPYTTGVASVASRGGATVDCSTRQASCSASSKAEESDDAIDGRAETGWCPDPREAELGPSWWSADLGRSHSCIGLVLCWYCPPGATKPNDVCAQSVKLRVQAARDEHLGADAEEESAVKDLFKKTPKYEQVLPGQAAEKPDASILVSIKPEVTCEVPVIWFGRYVKIDFLEKWPQLPDGTSLKLSVRVVKVWQLAPLSFRNVFSDALRHVLRKNAKDPTRQNIVGAAVVDVKARYGPGFWVSSTDKLASHNQKVNKNIELYEKRRHDLEDFDTELLANARQYRHHKEVPGKPHFERNKPLRKEFHLELQSEIRKWRTKIHGRIEDAQECTFHPRAAGNILSHVREKGERIGKTDRVGGVMEFVKDIEIDSGYKVSLRRAAFSKAKKTFMQGDITNADNQLRLAFNVDQIIQRFRCYHQGCGKLLTGLDSEKCGLKCQVHYCSNHHHTSLHGCEKIADQIKATKTAKIAECKEQGEKPPPDENFGDNKKETGLYTEVMFLGEAIEAAKQEKVRHRARLERLEQSLALFGPIRLAERPYKRRLCPMSLPSSRGSRTEMGDCKLAPFSSSAKSAVHCDCPGAHRASELRFPAGESEGRRAEWLNNALENADFRENVVIGSAAERAKMLNPTLKKVKANSVPKRSKDAINSRRRALSEPKAVTALKRRIDLGAQSVAKASAELNTAKVRMKAGEFEQAQKHACEAWNYAAPHTRETDYVTNMIDGGLDGQVMDTQVGVAASRWTDLRSQIRALASADAPVASDVPSFGIAADLPPANEAPGRALRHCEREDLLRRSNEISRDSCSLLAQCSQVETELRHRAGQAQSDDDAALLGLLGVPNSARLSPDWLQPSSASAFARIPSDIGMGVAASSDIRGVGVAGYSTAVDRDVWKTSGSRQMCPDLLDKGFCTVGPACPHAHKPSELSTRPEFD